MLTTKKCERIKWVSNDWNIQGLFVVDLLAPKLASVFFPQESLEVDKAEFRQIDIFNLYKWFLDVFWAARPTHDAQRSQDIL